MEFKYVWYPKPYVNLRVLSRTEWLHYALDSIVSPSESIIDVHPWYQTGLAQGHLGMLDRVAGSFYRLEFDSKCKIGKMPPCRDPEMQRQKKLVDACGKLWGLAWRVLERMEVMGTLPALPSIPVGAFHYPQKQALTPHWLMALVLEGELLTPWIDYLSPDGAQGIKKLLEQQQNDNGKMRSFENPFVQPCTQLFIDKAIATADGSDRFRANFYNPMVRQRQAITALIQRGRFVAFDLDGKPIRSGRKKK